MNQLQGNYYFIQIYTFVLIYLYTYILIRRAFRNLVSGLAHMHSHHIAHRDIKPDNLLVDFNVSLYFHIFNFQFSFSFFFIKLGKS